MFYTCSRGTIPEKHGDAGVCHVPADRLPRLGDDEHLAFAQRHPDAASQLIQTAVGRQSGDAGRRGSHVVASCRLRRLRLRVDRFRCQAAYCVTHSSANVQLTANLIKTTRPTVL